MRRVRRKNAIVSYEPIEKLVREATSNDPWGAKSTLMAEIALATNDHTQYNKLFAMLWKRLNDDANVLHVQKVRAPLPSRPPNPRHAPIRARC